MRNLWLGLVLLLAAVLPGMVHAQTAPDGSATCIAPAQPDGGFDLTCRMLAQVLDGAGILPQPLQRGYMPGGVGAVAFNAMTGTRAAEGNTLVAFSEGTIYNLAKGSFGDHHAGEVRWLAQLAQDYGAIVVRDDAAWADLPALLAAMRKEPQRIAIGGGGTIGGQDWMRGAMTAELAGIDHRKLRFVAFEGAGSCTQALLEGFVQACMNDMGDARTGMDAGKPLRILAVFAPRRLPGDLSDVPTAREQGVPLDWPVMRGVYMGAHVSDQDFAWWQAHLARLMASADYARILERYHLQAKPVTGPALEAEIATLTQTARARLAQLGVP
ncbi:Bug family tripartite tricarboxylate transporter substrate binding protein [Paracoccus laeviglucosivorans]|uniref:Putative tricarboxylic transport membrane protein n=1 Tax=Paracoccus laeviglucosivorans TaxID=1197861 RepID=A0A521EB94_9RHOB|nr:tripartite tricarboxylate transporter substrate-binding protein [Paracoccus laeviglucosivorans]SMO81205.1 putative tricarboxylic transport membrane protein [Paracoccus laeviglucosivorans]